MGTRCYIGKQIADDQHLTIFCQLNGCPADTGATLVKYYTTPDRVDALLALGDLYYLEETLSPSSGCHNSDTPQPGVTVAYQRDKGYSDCAAAIKTFKELSNSDLDGIEYVYIYSKDGQWSYMPTGCSEARLRNLKEDLKNGTVQYNDPPDLAALLGSDWMEEPETPTGQRQEAETGPAAGQNIFGSGPKIQQDARTGEMTFG